MAIFSKLVTTQNGRALIARMLAAEEKIVFTKVRSSDTEYTLEELENLEELTGIKQTNSVSKVSRTNPVSVKVETVFTNTELTEGYPMRTVALYAQDGDGEILYAAAVETSGNCYMPAFGGTTVSGAYIQLVTTVSNAENVTLEVDNSVFATIGDIRDLQEQIDSVSGLVGGMAAAINTNAEKLGLMERIGSEVYLLYANGGAECTNSHGKKLYSNTRKNLPNLNSVTYYLYVLTGNVTLTGLGKRNDIYEGFVRVTLGIGSSVRFSQDVPICRGVPGEYISAPVNIVAAEGPPFGEDGEISVYAHPILCKQDENKEPFFVEDETFHISVGTTLYIYKLGGVLASVQGSGTVQGGGTLGNDNYNLLKNKPSINNVTLQGNLTTEQLGIEVGSGVTEEITYEKALAILNGEEEVSES